MQTEPIGFKGTKGEFGYEYDNDEYGEFFKFTGTTLNFPYNGIGLKDIGEADAKLMAASKNMAIALQNLLDFLSETDYSDIFPNSITQAKEALKKAGL